MSEVRKAGRLPIATRADFEMEWARRSYLRYCQYVHHGAWVPGRHHRLICEVLDMVARGELMRVMFWLPPQHGKSMTITETFPSYYLGRNPRNRVIEASYNDDFARKFGRRNREKVTEFGSRLHTLYAYQRAQREAVARQFILEALAGEPGVELRGVSLEDDGEGSIHLTMACSIDGLELSLSSTYRQSN